MSLRRHAVGVDVGGTTIKAALVADDGTVAHRGDPLETQATAGPDVVLARIADTIAPILDHAAASGIPVDGIGVGVPGVINDAGEISYPPNFPGWEIVPVAERLSPFIAASLPIIVENDANVAAVAEAHAGAGSSDGTFLYVTLGTGVGGCIIADGQIWRGATGGAGEVGHVSIDYDGRPCNCGSRGCVEAYLGQRYMSAIAAERLADAPGSAVHARLAAGEELTPRLLDEAADAGDPFAVAFLAEMGTLLGAALASAMNLLDIHVAIIGGGLSQSERNLLAPARASLEARVLRSIADAELRVARFSNDAGMIGAALLAMSGSGTSGIA